jgi:protease I
MVSAGIIFLLILGINAVSAETVEPIGWNKYQDPASEFSVSYPPGASLFVSSNDTTRSIIFSSPENQTILQVVINPVTVSLKEAANDLKLEISSLSNPEDFIEKEINLGDMPVWLFEFTSVGESNEEQHTSIWLIQSEKYQFVLSSQDSAQQQNVSSMGKTIAESFTLIPANKQEITRYGNYQTGWMYPGVMYDPFGMMTGYDDTSAWNQMQDYPGSLYGQMPYDYNSWYYYPGEYDEWEEEYPQIQGYEQTMPEPVTTGIASDSSCTSEDEGYTYSLPTISPTQIPDVSSTLSPDSLSDAEKIRALIGVSPTDYNEEELSEVISALERAGIYYDIASTRSGTLTGMGGGSAEASLSFEEVQSEGISSYAAIILIGGEGAMTTLYDDATLHNIVRQFDQENKIISAICASPVVLSRAGILNGKRITLFGDPVSIEEVQSNGAIVSEEPVVTDGRIITGNGPYASSEFGNAVVTALSR